MFVALLLSCTPKIGSTPHTIFEKVKYRMWLLSISIATPYTHIHHTRIYMIQLFTIQMYTIQPRI